MGRRVVFNHVLLKRKKKWREKETHEKEEAICKEGGGRGKEWADRRKVLIIVEEYKKIFDTFRVVTISILFGQCTAIGKQTL